MLRPESIARALGRSPHYAPVAAFALLLVVYEAVFGKFFPNAQGALGSDYAGTLPGMLDGYFWATTSGFWRTPWFTPGFCGGIAHFADPNAAYFDVPMLLTLLVDPMRAMHLTLLIFASIGFWGSYLLARRVFAMGVPASIFGAALFMYNGFFAHRVVYGHYGFHGFPLLPLTAFLLLVPRAPAGKPIVDGVRYGVPAGLLMAYLPQAGMLSLFVPYCLAIAVVACLALARSTDMRPFLIRSAIGAVVFAGLGCSKLVAGFSMLAHFERSGYRLPGFEHVADAVAVLFDALFLSPASIADTAREALVNVQWNVNRQELEYGLSLSPLLAVVLWGVLAVRDRLRAERPPREPLGARPVALFAGAALILVFVVAVNIYSPGWTAFIKSVPIVRSSSSFVRWFVVYVPFVSLVGALAVDRARFSSAARACTAAALTLLMVISNATADRDFYHAQTYRPDTVIRAWREVKDGRRPTIRALAVDTDPNGNVIIRPNRNDLVADGLSQLFCYAPIFGYRLEWFPVGDLHPGSALDESDGHLNVKNPACYVFPRENECRPGDPFPAARRADAASFLEYRPFPFAIPSRQRVANAVTELTLALAAAFFAWLAATSWRAKRRELEESRMLRR